jgi:hypothetical protein
MGQCDQQHWCNGQDDHEATAHRSRNITYGKELRIPKSLDQILIDISMF